MIQAVLDFDRRWREHPAELVFRELVRNERIASAAMSQDRAKRCYEALSNLNKASLDLGKWMASGYEEKKQRCIARKRQQEAFQKSALAALLRPRDLAAFAKNGSSFLAMVLNEPDLKQIVLAAYLGQTWKRWHSAETAEINSAFARLDYKSLLKLPYTHSYLLAELLYDLGPITKFGPTESEQSNPQVLSGKQINNEEDQQY